VTASTRSDGRRGVWAIVARREFVERARDRGFVISTAITLLILVGVIVATSVFNRGTVYDLAVVGADARPLGEEVVAAARSLDVDVRLTVPTDEGAAARAVREERADAAVVGDRIVVRSDAPDALIGVVQAVSLRLRAEAALRDSGLTAEQVRAALVQPPLEIDALEPVDDRRRELSAVAFVGVLALYGQLFAYGYWVAAGVVEEKSSRVVEVLLATVRPSQLLRGKIAGIGMLGLSQLLLIGVIGLVTSRLVGSLDFPAGAVSTIAIVLLWFVLGFFFYAGLFAVAGSIVSRQEDLQSTMTPLTILIVASFIVGINATSDPSSTLATVASLLPPSAPLVMPTRLVLGESGLADALLSAAISIGATIALIPIATKIYTGAVLRPGRVRLRQVWRMGGA
jgi:ABC-2 type transport system permease protein